MIFTQAIATNSPEKSTPSTKKEAQTWSKEVTSTLSEDLQLSFLNFFAFNAEQSIPALIKCAEYIESKIEMLPSSEQLGFNIMQKIKNYVEDVQEKIALKANLTKAQEESLWQKLDIKIQELVTYINSIYYKTLYNYMAKKSSSSLLYMFDENGIIPQEKRTQPLPKPE